MEETLGQIMDREKEINSDDEFFRELARKKYNEFSELARIERESAASNKQTAWYSKCTFWVVAIPMAIVLLLIVIEYVIMFRL